MSRTMIIEADRGFRRILSEILEAEFFGMEVSQASTGAEALRCLDHVSPDLVFVILPLSAENGSALINILRRRQPRAFVIVLTDFDFPEYGTVVRRYGADFTLSTRISSLKDILSLVESILLLVEAEYPADQLSVAAGGRRSGHGHLLGSFPRQVHH
jgi:DNA-binding NarL/FixJ family response regulator